MRHFLPQSAEELLELRNMCTVSRSRPYAQSVRLKAFAAEKTCVTEMVIQIPS